PNKAHIIVELAKQTSSYLIAKGRLFKAGKDSLGKEVSYAMDRDVVFNKAKVANLLAVTNQGRLFASPLTNSADGLGAIFSATAMPKAAIGFALASHYLYLTEGERLVNIKFSPAFTSNQQDALKHADCYLSSEKEWYKVGAISWGSGTLSESTTSASVLSFTLPGDAPAITDYNEEVHGGTFNTALPILKLILKNDDSKPYAYESLANLTISKIEIEVKVGLDRYDEVIDGGLKNLSLSRSEE